MKTTFNRIYTSDGLELHGLLYEPDTKTESVLVHIHGMGGNFYENKFLDFVAKKLTDNGFAFCVFNNRGCEFLKDTYRIVDGKDPEMVRVGTTYEKFEESPLDIEAFIDFVEERGFSDIHLSGHSLGCPKVAYYMAETNDSRIKSLLLLSPSDMLGLVRSNKEQFEKEITEAKKLVAENKGDTILSEWVWGEYPVSANTYLSLFDDNAKDAIFNFHDPDDKLETLGKITVPTYAVMGTKDDALVVPIDETFSRLEIALASTSKKRTEILGDANHGYRGHEQEIADAVAGWLSGVNS
ncbi:alpha/beta hydrolase [Candidatus Kaiserbacteria bacterium]|nr:alpha/beta hydrolase [Candidatus Kaiserbacteria bacterium]